MSKPITEAGTINQLYWSEEMSKKFREMAMNASPLQAIKESEPMDDNCPAARIGELGNQVHNLGCDYQNDEDLSDELGQVAVTLWDLAKKAGTRTDARPEWDGTGLPPVGAACECDWTEWGRYAPAVVRFIGSMLMIVECEGVERVVYVENAREQLRPIRTPEQREREEVVETARAIIIDARSGSMLDDILQALYDAGMLREAGE